MTRHGIEPRSPGPLANTQPTPIGPTVANFTLLLEYTDIFSTEMGILDATRLWKFFLKIVTEILNCLLRIIIILFLVT